MTDLRVDEIHLADVALILLERRDLLRVGRPDENRAIAVRPAGVVRGVAEVLHAIAGELRLAARCDVAHPQIPIADERAALAVGRQRLWRARTRAHRARPRRRLVHHASASAARSRSSTAAPQRVVSTSQLTDRPPIVTSIMRPSAEKWFGSTAGERRQRSSRVPSQPRRRFSRRRVAELECRAGIDDNEIAAAVRRGVRYPNRSPESQVGRTAPPRRARRVVGHEPLSARIVRGGHRALLGNGRGAAGSDGRKSERSRIRVLTTVGRNDSLKLTRGRPASNQPRP